MLVAKHALAQEARRSRGSNSQSSSQCRPMMTCRHWSTMRVRRPVRSRRTRSGAMPTTTSSEFGLLRCRLRSDAPVLVSGSHDVWTQVLIRVGNRHRSSVVTAQAMVLLPGLMVARVAVVSAVIALAAPTNATISNTPTPCT